MQKYVCEKYGISRAELQRGVEQFSKLATGKFAGDTAVLLAILDLLCNGDVPAPMSKETKQNLASVRVICD